jgi:adenylate cyclase, class 2
MAHGNHETEIKLPAESAAAARRLLRRFGFRVFRRRVFEANTVFDTEALSLGNSRCLLRLREAGGKFILTYKGPPKPGPHKSREEVETELKDGRNLTAIFERLGFRPVFRYEKYRTEYRRRGSSGVATLDETPIGVYLELEGAPRWIDRTARELGFTPQHYITASYGRLYLDWCSEHGAKPSNMVFR